jgi:CTP synthase
VEIIELPSHPFFIATQFHPEFQSTPSLPHPLFKGLMSAALAKIVKPQENYHLSELAVDRVD